MKLTVKDIITSGFFHGDIDVCDDFDERSWIAYCGQGLTDEGEKQFADALALPCWFNVSNNTLIVECKGVVEATATLQLFYSMAGFCTVSQYDEWFI